MSELRRSVLESLVKSGYAALNFVTCEVHGSRVVLEGSVPSYHLKQLAQAFVLKVDGVARVENRLRVGMRTEPKLRCGKGQLARCETPTRHC